MSRLSPATLVARWPLSFTAIRLGSVRRAPPPCWMCLSHSTGRRFFQTLEERKSIKQFGFFGFFWGLRSVSLKETTFDSEPWGHRWGIILDGSPTPSYAKVEKSETSLKKKSRAWKSFHGQLVIFCFLENMVFKNAFDINFQGFPFHNVSKDDIYILIQCSFNLGYPLYSS